jgi:hypothetical protein
MQAQGEGLGRHFTAGQEDARARITIHLSNPTECSDGTRIFTRIFVTWYYPSGPQQYSWRYYCQARPTTSIGAGGG